MSPLDSVSIRVDAAPAQSLHLQINTETTVVNPAKLDYDLAIVGGGIIGNTLAVALQNSGLRVVSIESQAQSESIAKSRAYVLSMLSGQIFEGLGIWNQVLPQVTQFSQIQISDADYAGVVKMYPQDLGTDTLGYAASHEVLLTALQSKLVAAENITVMCPAQVVDVDYTDTGAEITVYTPDCVTPKKNSRESGDCR